MTFIVVFSVQLCLLVTICFFLLLFTRCCYCSVVTVSVEVTTSGLCCSFLCRFVGEGGPQNSHRSPSTNDDSSWSVYHQVYAELVYCWINKLHCESCGPLYFNVWRLLTWMYEGICLLLLALRYLYCGRYHCTSTCIKSCQVLIAHWRSFTVSLTYACAHPVTSCYGRVHIQIK